MGLSFDAVENEVDRDYSSVFTTEVVYLALEDTLLNEDSSLHYYELSKIERLRHNLHKAGLVRL